MGLQHRDVPRCQAGASWGRSLQFLIFCFETPALAASFPPGQSEPVRALTAGRNVQQINQPLRFNASKTQTPLRRPFRGPPCPHLAAQGFGQGRGTGPCCRASTRVAMPVRMGTRAPACACSCLHTPTPPCSCPRSLCRLPGCQELGGSSSCSPAPGARALSVQHGCGQGFGLLSLAVAGRVARHVQLPVSSRAVPWGKATYVGQILGKAPESAVGTEEDSCKRRTEKNSKK